MKSPIGRIAELRGQLEIVMRRSRTDVADVGREINQFVSNLLSLRVPSLERLCNEAVTNVMKSWWTTSLIQNVHAQAQLPPGVT